MNAKKQLRKPFLIALLLFSPAAFAETLVIDGGTIHPVVGEPYVGRVVVEDGLIAAAGPDVSAPSGAARIDAAGLHVFPGMFDALSSHGLLEIGSVPETHPSDIPWYVTDNSRVTAQTGWAPSHSVEETLSDIFAWLGENRRELEPLLS